MTNLPGSHTDPNTVVSSSKQRLTTTLAALTAIVDVVLAVIAGNFFSKDHRAIWVTVVIVVGVIAVVLQIITVQAEGGGFIKSWALIRSIVVGRAFIAIVAAALAGAMTYALVKHYDDKDVIVSPPTTPPTATTAAPTPAPSPTTAPAANCRYKEGTAGVVPVVRKATAPADLTLCPVLLNNGEPITGPFGLAGQFTGPAAEFKDLVIVNQADLATCDASGHPAVPGYFYARGMTIDADGSWSFRDSLGYDEAVTLGRNYMIVSGPPAAIEEIRTHRDKHPSDYAGMEALPAAAVVIGTFHQAPGKYKGKGSPCKNT